MLMAAQVTYRSLSRALKVHATLAKQYVHLHLREIGLFLTDCWTRMLFDFHRTENAKKPQTVHATYLISGIQKPPQPPSTNGHGAHDEDAIMQSSPYMPSSMPNQDAADAVRVTSILLVREEDLQGECFEKRLVLDLT
jgi:DNA polymerase delta subunit 3